MNRTIRNSVIGVGLIGAALALGACADDGYSRTSVGVGISSGDRYDRYDRRRDWDGDGIPNRFDLDRDGDGVPDRFDWAPNNPYRR